MLKKWYGSEAEQWIADRVGSGMGKKAVSVVDEILEDHLFLNQDGTMERLFKVRWASYGEREDTWESSTTLSKAACFRKYVLRKAEAGEGWAENDNIAGLLGGVKSRKRKIVTKKKPVASDESREDAPAAMNRGGSISIETERVANVETMAQEQKADGATSAQGCVAQLNEEVTANTWRAEETKMLPDASGKLQETLIEHDIDEEVMSDEQRVRDERAAMRQGRTFDHSKETWIGGRLLTSELEIEVSNQGRKKYAEEGDAYCLNCNRTGYLVQCDYCHRAYHARCAGLKRRPTKEEVWMCVFCAYESWPVKKLD
jgi:hypothetical protein